MVEVRRRSVTEGRKRLVQLAVLVAVGISKTLRESLAFKGGNALRFVHDNPRGTLDLDFTAEGIPDDESNLRDLLATALQMAGERFGIKLKCQSLKRQPPKPKGTLPTYDIAIGYQYPGDRHFVEFEASRRAVPTVVKMEVSFNDIVCFRELRRLAADLPPVSVCALDDILAEKLRALLQQTLRRRNRPQDVFDIARMRVVHGMLLDLGRIRECLIRKCQARSIAPSESAFQVPDVRNRALEGYSHLDIPIH